MELPTAELIDFNCSYSDLGGMVVKTTPVKESNNPFDEFEAKAGITADILELPSQGNNESKQFSNIEKNNVIQPARSGTTVLCNSPSSFGKWSALNYALLNHRQLTTKRLPFFSKSPNRVRIASDPGLLKTKQNLDILQKLRTSSFDRTTALNIDSPRSRNSSSFLNFSQMNDSLDDLNSIRLNLVESETEGDPDIDEMIVKFPVEQWCEIDVPTTVKLIDVEEIRPVAEDQLKLDGGPSDPDRQAELRQVLNDIKEKNEEEENMKFYKHLEDEVDVFIKKNGVKLETDARETLHKLIDLLAGKVETPAPTVAEAELQVIPSRVREGTFEIEKSRPAVPTRRQSLKPIIRSRRSVSSEVRGSSFNTTAENVGELENATTPKSAPVRRRNSVTFSNVKENIPPEVTRMQTRRSLMPTTSKTKLKNFEAAFANHPPITSKLKFKKPVAIDKTGPVRAVSFPSGNSSYSRQATPVSKKIVNRQSLNPQALKKPLVSSTPIQQSLTLVPTGTAQMTPLKSALHYGSAGTPSKFATPSRLTTPSSRITMTPSRLVTPVRSKLMRRNSLGQYNSPN